MICALTGRHHTALGARLGVDGVTAIHESAHAVVAHALHIHVRGIRILRGRRGGRAYIGKPTSWCAYTPILNVIQDAVSLAGPVAEILTGVSHSLSEYSEIEVSERGWLSDFDDVALAIFPLAMDLARHVVEGRLDRILGLAEAAMSVRYLKRADMRPFLGGRLPVREISKIVESIR